MSETIGTDSISSSSSSSGNNYEHRSTTAPMINEENISAPMAVESILLPSVHQQHQQDPSPVFVRAPTSLPIIPNQQTINYVHRHHAYSSVDRNAASISPLAPATSSAQAVRSASPSFAKNASELLAHHPITNNGQQQQQQHPVAVSVQPKPPSQVQHRYHYHHGPPQQLSTTPRQLGQSMNGGAGAAAAAASAAAMQQSSTSPSPSAFGPNSTASSYEEQRLTSITGPGSQYVKLNVGGSLHYTTIATLTKQPDSMLRAMFSGRLEVLTDAEGWILIDRCGKHFPLILNFLRDSNVALPESRREVIEILAEAKYYCLQGLVDLCSAWLEVSQRIDEEPAVCKVPIITTSKEEKALLASTTKPVVKLLLNRHNNKYSYTPQSDDNLLKNLELFDKLVLRFYERVMFIKDVGAANEVCSWSFYGHGKKVGEVCCTSIVYATDKKHTKVEFPEARIYEEAMNILLYEPPVMCSMCQSVACTSNSCAGDSDSPETASSPCCAGDCERIQLEKLQKARSAIRAASSGNQNGGGGTGGGGSGGGGGGEGSGANGGHGNGGNSV